MPDIRHGTTGGYNRGKCRCDECKRAHREAAAKYAAANADKVKATRRARYAADPSGALEATNRWRAANPEKVKEYDRRKYLRHRERIREQARVYYLLNREAFIEKAARWRTEHPERDRELQRERRRADPEKFRAQGRASQRRHREKYPDQVRERFQRWAQSPRGRAWFADNRARRRGAPFTEAAMEWIESLVDPLCTYCGKPADTIDHVIPIVDGGISDVDNLTPACMDCNRRKGRMSIASFLRLMESHA